MTKKSNIFWLIGLVILGLLPACGPQYQVKRLSRRSKKYTQECAEVKSGVSIAVRKLTYRETKRLFGKRSKKLLRRRNGIYPLHVTVANNSGDAWIVGPDSIDLDVMPPPLVADHLHTNTFGRVFGIGFISFAIWPLWIVTGIQGSNSRKANKKINADIKAKTFKHDITIAPGRRYEGLLFVHQKDYRPDCTVTLTSVDGKKRARFNFELES